MWIAFIITTVIGTLLHFTYEWFGNNKVVGIFSAVNESTWEHVKMAITAVLLYSVYDYYVFGARPNYFLAKDISILILIIVIPSIFYAYMYITKKCILIIDIAYFILTIFLSQFAFYKIIEMNSVGKLVRYITVIVFFILIVFYLTSTLLPAKNFLFKDPITNKYGFIDIKHFIIKKGVDSNVKALSPLILAADGKNYVEMLTNNKFQLIHTIKDIIAQGDNHYIFTNVYGTSIGILSSAMFNGELDGKFAIKVQCRDLAVVYSIMEQNGFSVVVEDHVVKSTRSALLKNNKGEYIYLVEHVKN